jgi:hypothetical protein
MIEFDPQPRVDVRVEDALTGEPRRLTTYSGTVWIGGRINLADRAYMFTYDDIDAPFFLPDSLPYDPGQVESAQLSVTVGFQVSGKDSFRVIARADLVPDPQGRPMSWLQVRVTGRTSVPAGLTYRADVLGPPGIVLPPPG